MLADAFRELHGSTLHGFSLLVALGDDESAQRAAGEALAAGAGQATALRHPERAAAWLRARALRSLHGGARPESVDEAVRREALAELGVEEAVFHGLAALSTEGRAALIASAVERFDPIDVETVLGAAPAATRRIITEARDRYLRVVGNLPAGQPGSPRDFPGGQIATRVRGVAARAISAPVVDPR